VSWLYEASVSGGLLGAMVENGGGDRGSIWVSLMGPLVVSHEVSKGASHGVSHEARGGSLMGLMGLMGSHMRPGGLIQGAGQVMGWAGLGCMGLYG
jgi:hypothetical protein